MNSYSILIKAARPFTVEAESESEAFDTAFEQIEWDYDIELLEENIEENNC